jgi:hypothetical protein
MGVEEGHGRCCTVRAAFKLTNACLEPGDVLAEDLGARLALSVVVFALAAFLGLLAL